MEDFLNNVPAVVWSGASGAIVALLGVLLANWQNSRRQKDQHAFDAREKKRDRTVALRKEVYLPLAAAWQEAQSYLGALIGTQEKNGEPLMRFAAAATKLTVVAEMPTAILANKVTAELTKTYLVLLLAAEPARHAHERIEAAKQFRIAAQENVKLAQLEIDKFLRGAQSDRVVFEALMLNKKRYDDMVQEYWNAELAAQKLQALHTLEYMRKLTTTIPNLAKLGFSLLLEARRDLELKTDDNSYISSFESEQESVLRVMHETINKLERYLSEEGQTLPGNIAVAT